MGYCRKELLYALVIALTSFNFGFILAHPSPVLPYYMENWNVSPLMATAFNSISSLAAAFGPYANFFLFKFVGRRIVAFIIALYTIASWGIFFLMNEKRFWVGIIARGMLGISLGASSSLAPLYLTEIAPTDQKGFYGSFNAEGLITSIMIMMVAGDFLSPYNLTFVGMSTCILQACLIWFVPETNSPGQFQEEGVNTIKENFWQKKIVLPLLAALSTIMIAQFCGPNAIVSNLKILFIDAKVPLKPGIAGAIVISAQLISVFLGSMLVDKLGSRVMWIVSGMLTSASLVIYGLNAKFAWHPFVAIGMIFLNQIAFGVGYGPMPWYLAPQSVPVAYSALASSLNSTVNWISSFIIIFLYEPMSNKFGDFGCFMLYGTIAFVGAIYGFFVIKSDKSKFDDDDDVEYQPQIDTDALDADL